MVGSSTDFNGGGYDLGKGIRLALVGCGTPLDAWVLFHAWDLSQDGYGRHGQVCGISLDGA